MATGPINPNRPPGAAVPQKAESPAGPVAKAEAPAQAPQSPGEVPDQYQPKAPSAGPTLHPQLQPVSPAQVTAAQQAVVQAAPQTFQKDPVNKGTFRRNVEPSRVPAEVLEGNRDIPKPLPPTAVITEVREGEKVRWQVQADGDTRLTQWYGPEDVRALVEKLKAKKKDALKGCPDPTLGHTLRSFYDERISQLEQLLVPVSLEALRERVSALVSEMIELRQRLARRAPRKVIADLAVLQNQVSGFEAALAALPDTVDLPTLLEAEGQYTDFAAALFHLKDGLGLTLTSSGNL